MSEASAVAASPGLDRMTLVTLSPPKSPPASELCADEAHRLPVSLDGVLGGDVQRGLLNRERLLVGDRSVVGASGEGGDGRVLAGVHGSADQRRALACVEANVLDRKPTPSREAAGNAVRPGDRGRRPMGLAVVGRVGHAEADGGRRLQDDLDQDGLACWNRSGSVAVEVAPRWCASRSADSAVQRTACATPLLGSATPYPGARRRSRRGRSRFRWVDAIRAPSVAVRVTVWP